MTPTSTCDVTPPGKKSRSHVAPVDVAVQPGPRSVCPDTKLNPLSTRFRLVVLAPLTELFATVTRKVKPEPIPPTAEVGPIVTAKFGGPPPPPPPPPPLGAGGAGGAVTVTEPEPVIEGVPTSVTLTVCVPTVAGVTVN